MEQSSDDSTSEDRILSGSDSSYEEGSQCEDGSSSNETLTAEPKLEESHISPKPPKLERHPILLKLEEPPISPKPLKLERGVRATKPKLERCVRATKPKLEDCFIPFESPKIETSSCLFNPSKPPSPYSVLVRDTIRPSTNHVHIKSVSWFTHLLRKRKVYEGRLNRNRWATIRPGQTVRWSDGKRTVRTRVTETRTYADFDVAFRDLGPLLIPHTGHLTPEHAKALYRNFYSNEDVRTYGVIAFKIEVQ